MIAKKLFRLYTNLRGWHTNKKIVVIESDDWGTIRMPGKEVFNRLSKLNPLVANDPYSRCDTLASYDDLSRLFEVLTSFKDANGNHPVITANTIVANPDFRLIENSGYTTYHFEPFYETITRQQDGKAILNLWKEGISQKIFVPQLHGREHVNVRLWLSELQAGNEDLLSAFRESCFGVPYRPSKQNRRRNLLAAYDHAGIQGETEFQDAAIRQGAQIFSDHFGVKASSFIAPAYTWHTSLEKVLNEVGIVNIQGIPLQYEPCLHKNKYNKKLHYTGEKNSRNQIYTVRNAFFEPSIDPGKNWLDECLARIHDSFTFKKPAIIGIHRINFIGAINQENREKNLKLFIQLLRGIVSRWPSVEFHTSGQLSDLILKK